MSNTTEYLTDISKANAQTIFPFRDTLGEVTPNLPTFLPNGFWTRTSPFANVPKTLPSAWFLFEGSGEGKGELVVTFWKDGLRIGQASGVWLDLVNVRKMYERISALPGNIPAPHGSAEAPPRPSTSYMLDPGLNQWDYPPVSWTETSEYVVYVHGWNVSYEQARANADTTFKRFWQRGYRGRISAFYWPTLVGTTTFNESEFRAWLFGNSLRQYVDTLPESYSRSVIAHSLGNVVVGAALRDGMQISHYALIDAAVAASCYDGNPSLQQGYGVSPDNDDDVITKRLAYKERLEQVAATSNVSDVTSFFLQSDDALALWVVNNQVFKPETFLELAGLEHSYKYFPGNPIGQKLFLTFIVNPTRILTEAEESLAYAAKSSTKAVGAEPNARGSITSAVDLASFGYEHEHSALWSFGLQKVAPVYNTLMDKLRVERNP